MLTFVGESKDLKDLAPFTPIVVKFKGGVVLKCHYLGICTFTNCEDENETWLNIAIDQNFGYGKSWDLYKFSEIACVSLE